MAKYKTIGQVLKRKAPAEGVYIKISQDIMLKAGDIVNVSDPRKQADELLKLGVITEEVAEKMRERAATTPEWVKFNLSVKA